MYSTGFFCYFLALDITAGPSQGLSEEVVNNIDGLALAIATYTSTVCLARLTLRALD